MIRLSRLADYAVLLMSHMAREPSKVHAAGVMAGSTHLPVPTVSDCQSDTVRSAFCSTGTTDFYPKQC